MLLEQHNQNIDEFDKQILLNISATLSVRGKDKVYLPGQFFFLTSLR